MIGNPHLAFSHVGIFVRDMLLMEDFYTRVLGFFITDRGFVNETRQVVFLSRDPREHHQIVLASGRPAEPGFNVINQLSFRLLQLADLRHYHRLLADEPISEMRAVTHGIAWSIYFHDPEGNRIEMFCDTPWYTPQPLLEPLDFGLTDEEIIARTAARCMQTPGFKSHEDWRRDFARRLLNN